MEKPDLRLIHIRLTVETHKKMRIRVAEEDTDIQHWVAALIEKELSDQKSKGGRS